MLKRLALLGLLLASLGNLPPIPGQTANHGSQTAQEPENQANSGKSPAKPTLTFIEKNCDSGQFKNDADCKKAENNEGTIAVSKLPTANVTIQSNAKRDFPDWVSFWVSFALAMAGFGGVAVGVFTVLYIKRQTFEMAYQRLLMRRSLRAMRQQAALMERQTEILDKSVAVSKASADAANAQIQMVKDKERARISVSIDYKEFEISLSYSFDPIPITIANDGTTSAFNVRAKGNVFGQPGDTVPYMGNLMSLDVPSTIRANADSIQADVTLVQDVDLRDLDKSPIPYFFHIGGIIEYEDVFGDSHETTFRYRFQVSVAHEIGEGKSVRLRSFYGWKRFGSTEENRAT